MKFINKTLSKYMFKIALSNENHFIFRRALQSQPSIEKGEQKWNDKQITVSTNKIYQLYFLEEIV